jgi:hypothetical protein
MFRDGQGSSACKATLLAALVGGLLGGGIPALTTYLASMCIAARADETLIERWIAVGGSAPGRRGPWA